MMTPRLVLAALVVCSVPSWLHAQPGSQPTPPGTVLEVPFVSQTPLLCGGAAAAIVARYWGARGIHAEAFRPLVDEARGGIPTDRLVERMRDLGWQANPVDLTWNRIRTAVSSGQPVIALIEEAPGRYHYVVLVGLRGDRILLHDPSIGPYESMPVRELLVRSGRAGRWGLLVLPGETGAGSSEPAGAAPAHRAGAACAGDLDRAVRMARQGDPAGARRLLTALTRRCPSASGPYRELAGLDLRQSRFESATEAARRAVDIDGTDVLAWKTLATSRYLAGEVTGALDAWNEAAVPDLDLVRIHGLRRTRHPLVERTLGLEPGDLLRSGAYRLAQRRLDALPAAGASRVSLRPVGNDLAVVEAHVVERPLLPADGPAVTAAALRAAGARELAVQVASPFRSGELWTGSWRWWESRPRVALTLSAPGVAGLPGVFSVEGAWERETFADEGAGASRSSEVRRRVGVSYADWLSADLHASFAAGVERWKGPREAVAWHAGVGLERRWRGDRLHARSQFDVWLSRDTGPVARLGAQAGWGYGAPADRTTVRSRIGIDAVSRHAPLMLWPGAGAGQVRPALLRAHRLIDAGGVGGEAFGRTLASGGIEVTRRVSGPAPVSLAAAAFLDAAAAWQRAGTVGSGPWLFDAGVGLRLRLPGHPGALRVDVARGVRDGAMAVSVGWMAWP